MTQTGLCLLGTQSWKRGVRKQRENVCHNRLPPFNSVWVSSLWDDAAHILGWSSPLVNPFWKSSQTHPEGCLSDLPGASQFKEVDKITITSLPLVNLTPKRVSSNHNILPLPTKDSCLPHNAQCIHSISSIFSVHSSKTVQKF
jgi:hypothetical protein